MPAWRPRIVLNATTGQISLVFAIISRVSGDRDTRITEFCFPNPYLRNPLVTVIDIGQIADAVSSREPMVLKGILKQPFRRTHAQLSAMCFASKCSETIGSLLNLGR